MQDEQNGKTDIPQVLILRHSKGFVAHIRYEDDTKNKDISGNSWKAIHAAVDKEILGDNN